MNVKGLKLSKDGFEIEEMTWGTAEDGDIFDRLLKLFERLSEE